MDKELKSRKSIFNPTMAFVGLILIMPIITFCTFQLSYFYSYYNRQSVEAVILHRTCFLEQSSGRHGETSTYYLPCEEMRREFEENKNRLEGRKRYVGAGRAAMVRLTIIVSEQQYPRDIYIHNDLIDRVDKTGRIEIKKPEYSTQSIEIISSPDYRWKPVYFLMKFLLPHIYTLLVLCFIAVSLRAWVWLKRRLGAAP